MGNLVQALCGAVFPVTKTPKPGSPVCPTCKESYDGPGWADDSSGDKAGKSGNGES